VAVAIPEAEVAVAIRAAEAVTPAAAFQAVGAAVDQSVVVPEREDLAVAAVVVAIPVVVATIPEATPAVVWPEAAFVIRSLVSPAKIT
jgi:hypothetical protein